MKPKKHHLGVFDGHGVQGPAGLVPGHLVELEKHPLGVFDSQGVQGPAGLVPGHLVKLKKHSLEVGDSYGVHRDRRDWSLDTL